MRDAGRYRRDRVGRTPAHPQRRDPASSAPAHRGRARTGDARSPRALCGPAHVSELPGRDALRQFRAQAIPRVRPGRCAATSASPDHRAPRRYGEVWCPCRANTRVRVCAFQGRSVHGPPRARPRFTARSTPRLNRSVSAGREGEWPPPARADAGHGLVSLHARRTRPLLPLPVRAVAPSERSGDRTGRARPPDDRGRRRSRVLAGTSPVQLLEGHPPGDSRRRSGGRPFRAVRGRPPVAWRLAQAGRSCFTSTDHGPRRPRRPRPRRPSGSRCARRWSDACYERPTRRWSCRAPSGGCSLERYRLAPWDVHVWPPGVDLDRFTPGEQRARQGATRSAAGSVRRRVHATPGAAHGDRRPARCMESDRRGAATRLDAAGGGDGPLAGASAERARGRRSPAACGCSGGCPTRS